MTQQSNIENLNNNHRGGGARRRISYRTAAFVLAGIFVFSAVIVGVTLGTRGPRDTLAAHQHNFTQVVASGLGGFGGHDFLALDEAGSLFRWVGLEAPVRQGTQTWSQIAFGGNEWGIGIDRTTGWLWRAIAGGSAAPVPIGIASFTSIAASSSNIGGITTGGQLMAWHGQTQTHPWSWTGVGAEATRTDWASLGIVQSNIFAITTGGQLWRIGFDLNWQGNPVGLTAPVRIGSASNWRSISVGNGGGLLLTTNGELHSISVAGVVARIGVASNWASISSDGSNHAAINNAGHLYTWGSGVHGDGTSGARTTPARILSTHTFSQVDVRHGGIARQTNGDVWIWGGILGTSINPAVRHIQGVVTATVQFRNSQNGAALATVSVTGIANTNHTFALPQDVPRPTSPNIGYNFSHWENATVSRNIGNGGALLPHYVTPVFTRYAATATFMLHGGNLGGQLIQYQALYIEGSRITQPRNPFRLGFAFAGWYTAASGGMPFNFAIPRTGEQTIHAQWIPLTGNVVMLHFAGGMRPDETSWAFNSDRPYTLWLPPAGFMNLRPPAFGLTFQGWFTNPEFTGAEQFEVEAGAQGPQEFFGRWV